jgi:hydrogenase maturation protein HypF
MSQPENIELAKISARGIVQGVGFRPFVYQLARKYNLRGWVCNTSEDVKIEVEGSTENIESFLYNLEKHAPPLAHIEELSVDYRKPKNYTGFEIRHSIAEEGKYQLISPDIATCQPCRDEIFNPDDRRYRYPFTNCTNCGPRFTIIEDIPYDRPRTTMSVFKMCPACQREYDDPMNRRFHAQPNACPVCGPQLELVDSSGNQVPAEDIISKTVELLRQDKIIAIKGLGGFLLACDATSEPAVKLLRERKRRPSKPFAVMVANTAEAARHCELNTEEISLLKSPRAPIVLLWWNIGSSICESVAPGLKYLGIMLPYTPLHHLLLKEFGGPLIMTSGNMSEEPIAKDNDEALQRLSGIADYFLMNNRDIYARYDDSVTYLEHGLFQIVRRARGYAPFPVTLPFHTGQLLACGADEKNAFCLTRDNYAFISQHIGDIENMETLEHLNNTVNLYKRLFRIEPEIIAYDMHPEYFSSRYALDLIAGIPGVKQVPVQHHHAHIASCMADNKLEKPVIGVALDGTGYGTDGHIWGGEFMIADYQGFTRAGHLEYLPLPGGDTAVKKPYRTALAYIIKLLGEKTLDSGFPFLKGIEDSEIEVIKRQVRTGVNTPLTSSMGRMFDAISAILNIRTVIDYDAQAAIELEMAAYDHLDYTGSSGYPFNIIEAGDVLQVNFKETLHAIVNDLLNRVPAGTISAEFHNTVVQIVRDVCIRLSAKYNILDIALSGGVFQNRLLLARTINLLESAGFKVFTHQQVPCNDGGISLGQAAIAGYKYKKQVRAERPVLQE